MAERLQKYLARAGLASRRAAEELITAGRVKVNNKKVTELGSRVEENDTVTVDGKLVEPPAEKSYYLLYKPAGVVTTLDDPQGRATVADYVSAVGRRLFPVGRLDYDAEGALLFTDDGELANRLTHPRFEVPRIYLAKVKGVPDAATLDKLRGGVRLEDGMATPKDVQVFEAAERNTWLKLVVTEGRPHLIKRLCAAVGHPVVRLFRPAHAGVGVSGMRPGEVRQLSGTELRLLEAISNGRADAPGEELRLPPRRHGRSTPGVGADVTASDRGQDEDDDLPEEAPPPPGGATKRAPRERAAAGKGARRAEGQEESAGTGAVRKGAAGKGAAGKGAAGKGAAGKAAPGSRRPAFGGAAARGPGRAEREGAGDVSGKYGRFGRFGKAAELGRTGHGDDAAGPRRASRPPAGERAEGGARPVRRYGGLDAEATADVRSPRSSAGAASGPRRFGGAGAREERPARRFGGAESREERPARRPAGADAGERPARRFGGAAERGGAERPERSGPGRTERGGFARTERGGFGRGGAERGGAERGVRTERGGFPAREARGGFGREERGAGGGARSFGARPGGADRAPRAGGPRPAGRGGFGGAERPPRREGGFGGAARPPRREGGFGAGAERPPRREGGFGRTGGFGRAGDEGGGARGPRGGRFGKLPGEGRPARAPRSEGGAGGARGAGPREVRTFEPRSPGGRGPGAGAPRWKTGPAAVRGPRTPGAGGGRPPGRGAPGRGGPARGGPRGRR
jgi:23S rRNA pseudouridine2605 synthase